MDACGGAANTLLGGAGGPMLGHDLGGERFPFLPPGGFDHDIPSDTDSDGRDESFQIAPPEEKTYMMDYLASSSAPDGEFDPTPTVSRPLDESLSERAAKLKWVNDQLFSYFRENAEGLRLRLEELNEHLPAELKCYLG